MLATSPDPEVLGRLYSDPNSIPIIASKTVTAPKKCFAVTLGFAILLRQKMGKIQMSELYCDIVSHLVWLEV